MRSGFFPKLAFQNIGKNKRFYIPYFITCIFTISMFYGLNFITTNDGMSKIHGYENLKIMLNFGIIIVAIFSLIFLFYTNSFLIKHRKKELGLYNILGMSKWNIAHVLTWETLITTVITLVLGLLFGVVFSKFMLLLLLKILKFDIRLGFTISFDAIKSTLIVFCIIYFLTLIYNFGCIKLSKPIELLRGGNVGEKEPKAKWVMGALGLIALAGAYYIALTTKDPVSAIPLFFFAVLLVIFGTYALFISSSIVVLKILRNKKSYYYKATHFTSVSGMIYRMKQNAAGLASICILATMVLVMISGTVCLNLGSEDTINTSAPFDVTVTSNLENATDKDTQKIVEIINSSVQSKGLKITQKQQITHFEITTTNKDNKFSLYDRSNAINGNNCIVSIVTDKQYNKMQNKNISLKDNEALAFYKKFDKSYENINLVDKDYKVKTINKITLSSQINAYISSANVVCIVLNDNEFNRINEAQKNKFKDYYSELTWETSVDLSGTEEQKLGCFNDIKDKLQTSDVNSFSTSSKQEARDAFLGLYGGLFFIGIFLGTMFVGFTALIIYYKQISEGYDDKDRFEIMQKVGMSKEEVKKTINSQVIRVFFLPLLVAIIHLAFAFKIITKLLTLLGILNIPLFVCCIIGTVIAFAIIYLAIYMFTAKSYYKIVNF